MKRLTLLFAVFLLTLSTSLSAQSVCDQVEKEVDQLFANDIVPWQSVEKFFPMPFFTQAAVVRGKVKNFVYVYSGCDAEFSVNAEGKISIKNFTLAAYQPPPSRPRLPESWHPKYIPLQEK
jgi:hypothetical protein